MEFTALSQETRTIILLVGWAIMVSAVHMLALYRRTVWLFGGSTLVYLAVLESAMEESIYGDIFACGAVHFAGPGHDVDPKAEAGNCGGNLF